MNHYKYIAIQIQDLSTSDLIHSASSCNFDIQTDKLYFFSSEEPLTLCVLSDDIENLLEAKQIMEEAINNIYNLPTRLKDTKYIKQVVTTVPLYLNNLIVYESTIASHNEWHQGKKLNKNRFQLIQTFVSKVPRMELFSGEIFY